MKKMFLMTFVYAVFAIFFQGFAMEMDNQKADRFKNQIVSIKISEPYTLDMHFFSKVKFVTVSKIFDNTFKNVVDLQEHKEIYEIDVSSIMTKEDWLLVEPIFKPVYAIMRKKDADNNIQQYLGTKNQKELKQLTQLVTMLEIPHVKDVIDAAIQQKKNY